MRLWVSLGCSIEERANPQPVNVDIRIGSPKEPIGCHSDQLSDVVCYKMIAEPVIESVKNRSFHLIESLAAHVFAVVVKQYDLSGFTVEVVITKPNHPVPYIQKGMTFTYRRRLSQKSL
ncbi:MAG: dihydroneopterin aldolase [Chlamydiales bacterium]|nr:dihydroneopterin aldolase [Chlamydiales bacterium]